MRNFPHQMNQIPKLRRALEVAAQLSSVGRNIGDDGELGFALTRRRIYTFRGLATPTDDELEAAIERERQKPLYDQGPRTSARDLRRTLVLLGFLDYNADGECIVSPLGKQILSLPDPPDPDAVSVWVDAVININLVGTTEEIEETHPALNMLRITAEIPNIEKQWLAFALEMNNDSEEELDRVLALRAVPFDSALQMVGASKYMAANGVKILPSLLEQLGLINIPGGRCTITPEGLGLLITPTPIPPIPTPTPRQTHQGRVITAPDDIPEHGANLGQTRTTEEQLHTAALLNERTNQHQELVRRIVGVLRESGQAGEIRVSEDAFDIAATIPARGEMLLIEAKTIRNDALVQSRIALGQILFYEHFDIHDMAEGRTIKRIVAFNDEPGHQIRGFLDAYDTSCLVINTEQIIAPDGYEDCFSASD